MSNLEANPTETICASQDDPHPLIEVLEPREVPLGGLRAMTVRRTLPQRSRSLIGAWCFLDHYGPNDVAVSGPMNVAAHPHTGLQTASWLFSGTIEHRDSAGTHAIVRPGELNLMTAGSGISHSERSTPDTTILHGAQLWIALPDRTRHSTKRFEHYAPPTISGDGFTAQVFLGALLGEVSPVIADTPLIGAELTLDPHTTLDLAVDPTHEHGVLVDNGSVWFAGATVRPERTREADATGGPDSTGGTDAIGGTESVSMAGGMGEIASSTPLEREQLGFAPVGFASLRVQAGAEGARILLIGGEPLGEEIIMWWNFIGRSHDEIVTAREAWQQTIARGTANEGLAADAPDRLNDSDTFGLPDDEPEPPLPAPAVPIARLKPRGHLPPLPTGPNSQSPQAAQTPQVADPAPSSAAVSPAAASPTGGVADPADEVRVTHEPDKRRYAITVGGTLAGFARYSPREGALAFIHTEISPQFGGRGLASTLISQALAEVRASGSRIIPYCPFVAAWLKKHPDYEEIVDWPTQ